MLKWIDLRLAPPYLEAVREYKAACRADRNREVLDALSRTASRRKNDWMQSRERFLTPELTRMTACERIGIVLMPLETDAIPRR